VEPCLDVLRPKHVVSICTIERFPYMLITRCPLWEGQAF
jgi:hypothetical protein